MSEFWVVLQFLNVYISRNHLITLFHPLFFLHQYKLTPYDSFEVRVKQCHNRCMNMIPCQVLGMRLLMYGQDTHVAYYDFNV
jgi:hypothetical protein